MLYYQSASRLLELDQLTTSDVIDKLTTYDVIAKRRQILFCGKEHTLNSGKYKCESPFSRPNNLIGQLLLGHCLRTDVKSEGHSII